MLIDTGSQVTLLDSNFPVPSEPGEIVNMPVQVMGNTTHLTGSFFSVNLVFPNSKICTIPTFVIPNLRFFEQCPGLTPLVNKLKPVINISRHMSISHNDSIEIHGILGLDALQFFDTFKFSNFHGGTLLELDSGFIPIGDLSKFDVKANLSNIKIA